MALFLYDGFDEQGNLRRCRAIGYSVICFVLLFLFVVIWRFSTMNIDLPSLAEIIRQRDLSDVAHFPNYPIEDGLGALYYATNSENVAHNAQIFPYRYLELVFSLVMLSPLLVFFNAPLFNAARSASQKGLRVRYWLVMLAENALTLPVFFMATDYSRWFYCWFFTLFALPATLIAVGDNHVKAGTRQLWMWCRHHWLLSLFLLVYSAFALHPIGHDLDGLNEAIRLRQIVTHTNFD